MMKKNWPLYAALSLLTLQSANSSEQVQPVQPSDSLMPGHFALQNAYNVTLSGSALYWKAYEGGLDYAIAGSSGGTFIDEGRVKRMKFDWDWGFRLDLGYQIPNQKMDLDLIWTRFETSGSTSTSPGFPPSLFSVWTYPGAGLSTELQAKAHTDLKLNIADLVMGATFSPRKFLDITPSIGLSSAWIDQNFSIHLSGGSNTQIFNGIVVDDHIRLHNDFWGIGPKFGLHTQWLLGCGFSIIGNVDAALLYGLFEVKQSETTELANLTPSSNYYDIDHNRFHLLRANLDLLLGMRWERLFSSDRYRLSLEAGWETFLFWGQNQLMRFVTPGSGNAGINTTMGGDLCLQGLTMRGSFSF